MRTKPKAYPAALAIVALGALLMAPAAANADGGGKRALKLVGTDLQFESVDVGPAGSSLGDQLVFSESLERNGRDVGMSGVVCTMTHITAPYGVMTFQCISTLSLRRGQITLQGLIELQGLGDPGPFELAITGGTGAYRGAGGEAIVRQRRIGRVIRLRFDAPGKHGGRPHRENRGGRHNEH